MPSVYCLKVHRLELGIRVYAALIEIGGFQVVIIK